MRYVDTMRKYSHTALKTLRILKIASLSLIAQADMYMTSSPSEVRQSANTPVHISKEYKGIR